MLKRLFQYHRLERILGPLVDASTPQAAWWILDSEDRVLFRTVDRMPPADAVRWKLDAGGYSGCVVAGEDYPRIRALGDVMVQFLEALLQTEAQRQADETERLNAQIEAQVHYRISQTISTMLQREQITERLLPEALHLIAASGAIFYLQTSQGRYQLGAASGKVPYGSRPAMQLRKGLLMRVIEEGEALWLNDFDQHEVATIAERRARNVLAVPIRLDGKCLGVIALFDHANGFNSRHMRLLRVLANHAAIAYHNAGAVQALIADSEERSQDISGGESEWQEVYEHCEVDWKEVGE